MCGCGHLKKEIKGSKFIKTLKKFFKRSDRVRQATVPRGSAPSL